MRNLPARTVWKLRAAGRRRLRALQRRPRGEDRARARRWLLLRSGPRRVPRGDGRRSWRRLVGAPAGRSRQQPRYALCPRSSPPSPPPRALPCARVRAASACHRFRPAAAAGEPRRGRDARGLLTREPDEVDAHSDLPASWEGHFSKLSFFSLFPNGEDSFREDRQFGRSGEE